MFGHDHILPKSLSGFPKVCPSDQLVMHQVCCRLIGDRIFYCCLLKFYLTFAVDNVGLLGHALRHPLLFTLTFCSDWRSFLYVCNAV